MQSFIIVLLTAKIGFICHEAVTSLKLLEKGFSKEDLALSVLLDFPLQILFGYYAAKWSNGPRPLKPVSLLKIMEITLSNVILFISVALCLLWSPCIFRGRHAYRCLVPRRTRDWTLLL